VKQQGMEVLGVNLSPSVSFKDRYAICPLVMLIACLTLNKHNGYDENDDSYVIIRIWLSL